MNTRQLTQGLVPTIEFERAHTFKSLRQFPELRMSAMDIEHMKTRRTSNLDRSKPTLNISRRIQTRSTHKLDELSRSSLDDVGSAMTDFRKILLKNRRRNQLAGTDGNNHNTSGVDSVDGDDDSLFTTSTLSKEELYYRQLDPLEAANQKLTKISISFDALSSNSHLAGFQGAKLSKEEFATQLRRCVNINLRKVELDALFHRMDDDDSGLIDGVEFVRYFFQLGNEARWKMLMDTKQIQLKRIADLKRHRQEQAERIKAWEAQQISQSSPEDYQSAMLKLSEAAFKWDPTNHIDSLFIQGFEAFLSPYQFKIQIDKSFGVKLTNGEVKQTIHMKKLCKSFLFFLINTICLFL